MPRRNEEVAWLLEDIAELVGLSGESAFKVRAYREAGRTIGAMPEDVGAWIMAGKLEDIRGVGPHIARIVTEYLATGESGYYRKLRRHVAGPVSHLLEVPGMGPHRANQVARRLHLGTASDLEQAADEKRLRSVPGFGEKLEERIGIEAGRVARHLRRISLARALPIAAEASRLLRQHPGVLAVEATGSVRRMRETVGDIDLLVASESPSRVEAAFNQLPFVDELLPVGPSRSSVLTRDRVQIELRVVRPEEFGAALIYFTGSKGHNSALRRQASNRGWKLSQRGLFDRAGGRIAGLTEESIYQALDMDWTPPELRENQGEIEASLARKLPSLVTQAQLRGDLHVRTNWSDGCATLKELVQGAIARGYQYIAVADPSRGAGGVGGLSVEQVRLQRDRIEELNRAYRPFRILHGAEVHILPNGRLAYPDAVLAQLDFVAISLHSQPKRPLHQMTQSIIAALRNPNVHVLLHPIAGPMSGDQEVHVETEAVMRAAADYGVALELNRQPGGSALGERETRAAVGLGLALALGTEARSRAQMDYIRYAVATARRAGAAPDQVLNTLPASHLLRRLHQRGAKVAA